MREAKRLAGRLLAESCFRISGHARSEMLKDQLTEADVVNAIRHGVAGKATMQPSGHYSYRFTRREVAVAVAFRYDGETPVAAVVCTAWRIRRAARNRRAP